MYRASSGALVFGAGTVQWSWGMAFIEMDWIIKCEKKDLKREAYEFLYIRTCIVDY